METEIYPINNPDAFIKADAVLDNGGIIAFPTDTVYGVATKVQNKSGIEKIYTIKGRDFSKAIPVLIGDIPQLDIIALEVNKKTRIMIKHFWPGALTVVVLRQPGLHAGLSNNQTIGIRMPDYTPALRLMKQTGPLATTSANLSGKQNSTTAQEVLEQLHGKVDLILDGGATPGNIPSTVVDCTKPELVVLRQGIIPSEELEKVLSPFKS